MANIIEVLEEVGPFRRLVRAVETGGLDGLLRGRTMYTLFAATDEAFERLSPGEDRRLRGDVQACRNLVRRHLVRGNLRAVDLTKHRTLKNVLGENVRLRHRGRIYYANAQIIHMDLIADNGVVHALDEVVLDVRAEPNLPKAGRLSSRRRPA